jgi:hypothetical protein
MLNIWAGHRGARFCDGVTRREALQVGALGTLGLGLPSVLRAHAANAAESASGHTFGRAKRVILLFMWGGPAHQDTWDLKPDGPDTTRGEFLPIATNVPGIHISEHFPHIARHADKLAIIRSVGQDDNNHSTGAHAGLTGRRHELKAENFGPRETDFPHFGSVLSKLRPNPRGLPTFVSLPDIIATTAGPAVPGQGGGLLGRTFDPFTITDHPDAEDFSIASLRLPGDLATPRMLQRREMLQQIDQVARVADRSSLVAAMDAFYQQALDMVLSPAARKAFDLAAESETQRFRYGWHTFGQSVLMARRLIEAGVKLVTVYWHRERRMIDSSWDTHSHNFSELKNRLMPSVDRPIAALLEDLEAAGLLDETLVIWNSEFGRTPNVNSNGGRDHWGPCNSVVLAGGGVPGGQLFGASDDKAAYPTIDKVTQDDIAATIYHLLGLEPETLIYDRQNRPYPVALGQPIAKLLGGLSKPEPKPAPPPRTEIPQAGPFTRMLIERGGRFLGLDLGNADGEKLWQLANWSEPVGSGLSSHRALTDHPATAKYLGLFHSHFDYGWLVLRLAEPQPLSSLRKLTVGSTDIPLPAELVSAPATDLWQIPFPPGLISATKTFELALTAPGWKVTDLALVGDRIRALHLRCLSAPAG